MIRILIVDDEPAAGNILKLLIDKHITAEKEMMYCSSPEEALAALPAFKPTLVMLDIEMPGMNGFDFLNLAGNWSFDVIFTTAYDRYAIKAIRFSALDYLLKPIDIPELQNAVNRHIVKSNYTDSNNQSKLVNNLMNNLNQKNPAHFKLAISIKEGVFLYEPANIICLEGINNYTRLFVQNEKPVLVSRTLKEYEDILTEHGFLRVHKSFLVNTAHIKKMDNEGVLWMSQDLSIPVSRRKRAEVLGLFH